DRALERGRGRVPQRHLDLGRDILAPEHPAQIVRERALVAGRVTVPLAGVGGALDGHELDEVRAAGGELPARLGRDGLVVQGVEEQRRVGEVLLVVLRGHLVQGEGALSAVAWWMRMSCQSTAGESSTRAAILSRCAERTEVRSAM